MKKEKAKVLILGTFHMSDHGELFSTKRQTEIEVLVSKLANFEPTRIAIEMVTENNEPLNNKYKQYKLGSYNLEINEIYQIGFRLGIMLGQINRSLVEKPSGRHSLTKSNVYFIYLNNNLSSYIIFQSYLIKHFNKN